MKFLLPLLCAISLWAQPQFPPTNSPPNGSNALVFSDPLLTYDAGRRIRFEGNTNVTLNLWFWQFSTQPEQIHVYSNSLWLPALDEPNGTANIHLTDAWGLQPYGIASNVCVIDNFTGTHGEFVASVAESVSRVPCVRIQVNYEDDEVSTAISNAHTPIIQMSFGDTRSNPPTNTLFAMRALSNTLFVVSALESTGPEDNSRCWYLISHIRNVIGVNSFSKDGNLFYSGYGTNVLIAGPGRRVIVRKDGIAYSASGTSFAAPHVAGVCSLILAKYPNATPAELRQRLKDGADVSPQWTGLNESGGTLNAFRALQIAYVPTLTVGFDGVYAAGSNGTVLAVDRSTNLVDWQPLASVTNTGWPIKVDEIGSGSAFYRAQ